MMENMGMSAADIKAVMGDNDGMSGGGAWIWILILFLFGGNGFGRNSDLGVQEQIRQGFDTNTIVNKLDGIGQGICDSTYALNNTITSGNNALSAQLAACCCETRVGLLENRYAAERNTCDIVNAIRTDGDATRALINSNTMQELRDKLSAATSTIAQEGQTRFILDSLGAYYPKPGCVPQYYNPCTPIV